LLTIPGKQVPDSNEEREFQRLPSRFADRARIGHSAFKILLDFGNGGEYHARIITSHETLKEIIDVACSVLD
jgi:hypothetical protein